MSIEVNRKKIEVLRFADDVVVYVLAETENTLEYTHSN